MVRALMVLVLLVECTNLLSALPDTLDKALIYAGKSDKTLKAFHRALSKHEFAKMQKLYTTGAQELTKMTQILDKLSKLSIEKDTKAFQLKENLIVHMNILKEKMTTMFKRKKDDDE